MEVLNAKSAILSNAEVLNILKELQANDKGQKRLQKNQNLATISYETVKFLENTPCKIQNKEDVENFLRSVIPYQLTRAEKLQLLNHRPTSAVEIQLLLALSNGDSTIKESSTQESTTQLSQPQTNDPMFNMIEESEERLTEQDVENLLEVISQTLPNHDSEQSNLGNITD